MVNRTEEFLQKLAPCIERGEPEACVDEAARLAGEMGIGAEELLKISAEKGISEKYDFAYALALAAAEGLDGEKKTVAFTNAGTAASHIGKMKKAEELYKKAIEINPKYPWAHNNYANLLEELNKKNEAEEHYKKAIEINPKLAGVHYNYAKLLEELNRKSEAEEYYKKAIGLEPEDADIRIRYILLLHEMNKENEAEEHYKKAIELKPKDANLHASYARLLRKLNRKNDAEEHFKKAIDLDPKNAEVSFDYAFLLHMDLNRIIEAEEHYKKAIELDPKYAEAYFYHALLLDLEMDKKYEAGEQYKKAIEVDPYYWPAYTNYAIILTEFGRKTEAEICYLKAIEIFPENPLAHMDYSLLLTECDRRNESWNEVVIASNLLKDAGDFVNSSLVKAHFYEHYSEKRFKQKKYRESAEDADKASEEYLKAAETAEGSIKDDFILQGNVLKAKSFVRKIPIKPWYKKIYYKFGKNPSITELIDNLKNASVYYEKASLCPVKERRDVCNACRSAIGVFSDTLNAMSAFIKGATAGIDKEKWLNSLDGARQIYNKKKLKNGVALVATLEQLIKCVDELANYSVSGLHIQEERLGKCYNNLSEVSEKLDGALKIISEHAVEAIKDYAKKHGMRFVKEERQISILSNWLIGAIVTIILGILASIIANRIFSLDLDLKLLKLIKSLFNP